jgi:HNH endonuclease
LRPAPDCMTWLTALLPVAQGVACYAALKAAAASGVATGDGRGIGQLMADTLVTRITGQATADAVPIGLHLVMTATALTSGDCEPGRVVGHGPVPAALARRLVTTAPAVASWVKRLYESPTGLVATESRSRCFPDGLAELITIRDDTCATPWCDAPIRHIDHVTPWANDGPTALTNGQGLCAQCNLEKQDRQMQPQVVSDRDGPNRGQPRAPAQAQIRCAPAA